MSYILDALRKADAEREQGRVPGLHSQLGPAPLPATPEDTPPQAAAPAWPLMLIAGVVGAVVAAGALWWALTPTSTETANMPTPEQAATVAAAQNPTPSSMQRQAQPLTPNRAATTPRVEPVPAPNLALPQAAPQAPPPAPAPVAPAAAPAAPAQPVSAMPDAVRRSLPPLIFGGAMHSDNAASRMLVINNNVYREGDEPVPGLVLEQILLKSAVFRYQGQRFSVNY